MSITNQLREMSLFKTRSELISKDKEKFGAGFRIKMCCYDNISSKSFEKPTDLGSCQIVNTCIQLNEKSRTENTTKKFELIIDN